MLLVFVVFPFGLEIKRQKDLLLLLRETEEGECVGVDWALVLGPVRIP